MWQQNFTSSKVPAFQSSLFHHHLHHPSGIYCLLYLLHSLKPFCNSLSLSFPSITLITHWLFKFSTLVCIVKFRWHWIFFLFLVSLRVYRLGLIYFFCWVHSDSLVFVLINNGVQSEAEKPLNLCNYGSRQTPGTLCWTSLICQKVVLQFFFPYCFADGKWRKKKRSRKKTFFIKLSFFTIFPSPSWWVISISWNCFPKFCFFFKKKIYL